MQSNGSAEKLSAEAKIRAVLASIADCYVKVDAQWCFTEVNQAAEDKIYQRPAAELLGRNVWELYPHCIGNHFYRLYHQALTENRPLRGEGLSGVRNAWFEVYAFPCAGGLEVYSREITNRKLAEQQLTEAKNRAEEANAAKDRFLASLSHELRTPLTPILAGLQLLLRRNDLPGEVSEILQLITRNAKLEARLIDDLLDLSRVVQGKVSLALEELDLHHAIHAALDVCRARMEDKGLNLELNLSAADALVHGDKMRLQQVFWNIFANAVKFTPAGGTISVRSSTAPDGGLVISIKDTGAGIDSALLPTLFSPFKQEVAGQSGGLGLGLAISKGLLEAHGGTVEAFSDGKGRGSSFIIRLPARRGPAASPSPTTPSEHRPRARGKRILIVEDHPDTASMLRAALELSGHTVTHAGTVKEALSASAAQSFDVLLCDLGLPDGTGYDVMRGLGERQPSKAAALTGFGMEADRLRCKEAGFITHLTKPIDLDALQALIDDL